MDTSRFDINSDVATLDTRHGVLKVDVVDLCLLEKGAIDYNWTNQGCRKPSYYARIEVRRTPRERGVIARLIMAAPQGLQVDHINHDTLDNRRCNLRLCTRSENARNNVGQLQSKSRFKGVFFHKEGNYNGSKSGGVVNRWRAYTRVMGKRIWLGYHTTEIKAAMAYNRYASKAFGEFACYNRFERCPVMGEGA